MAHPDAGKLPKQVINIRHYEEEFKSPSEPLAKVKFGTSGHRGRLGGGFCRLHAQAIAQAVARFHKEKGIEGPILVGGDTRLMAQRTARLCAEVLTANGIPVILADIPLPTPVFSSEIIAGTAIAALNGTASHNPPEDMGLKYNPPHGGPAGTETTSVIEKFANECLDDPKKIKKLSLRNPKAPPLLKTADIVRPYVDRLAKVVDLGAIRSSGLRIGIHPLGGASIPFYRCLMEAYDLKDLDIVDKTIDPTFGFIPLDHDGKIRMDPSSKYPMSPLLDLVKKGKYDFVGASDPDADRFGTATASAGLVNPNHALAILFDYLLTHRPEWPKDLKAGRTIGTTHLIDRIAAARNRQVEEVDVGFKYYVEGIRAGRYALAGEESAGLSVYRWTTEKDGILAVMLLAEVMAKTDRDLFDIYKELAAKHGEPAYRRLDIPADAAATARVKALKAAAFSGAKSLAGEAVTGVRDTDGIKLYMKDSWVLARASGTEPIVKLYGESFKGEAHLKALFAESAALFGLQGAGVHA
ncbi:MAG: alpha-D-glucose phosphate-specific phosphoglucomutase [Elusimicrobia bacterium]|nr:alpha-D-glucose phosphate-specific phosphoglucomutase [Elusimicrobiota bacterium]